MRGSTQLEANKSLPLRQRHKEVNRKRKKHNLFNSGEE